MVLLSTGLDKEEECVHIAVHVTCQQLPIGEEFEMQDTGSLVATGYADEKDLTLVVHALIETHDRSVATTCVYKILTKIERLNGGKGVGFWRTSR